WWVQQPRERNPRGGDKWRFESRTLHYTPRSGLSSSFLDLMADTMPCFPRPTIRERACRRWLRNRLTIQLEGVSGGTRRGAVGITRTPLHWGFRSGSFLRFPAYNG